MEDFKCMCSTTIDTQYALSIKNKNNTQHYWQFIKVHIAQNTILVTTNFIRYCIGYVQIAMNLNMNNK
jgi:hypothetical protein